MDGVGNDFNAVLEISETAVKQKKIKKKNFWFFDENLNLRKENLS